MSLMWTNLSCMKFWLTEKRAFSACSMSSSRLPVSLSPRAEMLWPAFIRLRRVAFSLTIKAYCMMCEAVTTSFISSVK